MNEAKEDLQKLQGKQEFDKMITIVAVLTKLTRKYNLKPIIVGGLSVSIYTFREYFTSDIDLIFSRIDIIAKYLKELGFTKEGRYWYHKELGVSLEIPSDMLEADIDKVMEISISKENTIYVISIEDIILDRLRACLFWNSDSDCEWAERMYLAHTDRLDKQYLKEQSQQDGTIELMNHLIKMEKEFRRRISTKINPDIN